MGAPLEKRFVVGGIFESPIAFRLAPSRPQVTRTSWLYEDYSVVGRAASTGTIRDTAEDQSDAPATFARPAHP
jgi:hypothetical protein